MGGQPLSLQRVSLNLDMSGNNVFWLQFRIKDRRKKSKLSLFLAISQPFQLDMNSVMRKFSTEGGVWGTNKWQTTRDNVKPADGAVHLSHSVVRFCHSNWISYIFAIWIQIFKVWNAKFSVEGQTLLCTHYLLAYACTPLSTHYALRTMIVGFSWKFQECAKEVIEVHGSFKGP